MARDCVRFATCPPPGIWSILKGSFCKEKRGLPRVQQAGPAQAHHPPDHRTVPVRHGGHGGHHDGLRRRGDRRVQRGAGGSHQRAHHQRVLRPGHRRRRGVRPVHRRPGAGSGQPGGQPAHVHRHRRRPGDHGPGAAPPPLAAGPALRPGGARRHGGGGHLFRHLRLVIPLHRPVQRLRRPAAGHGQLPGLHVCLRPDERAQRHRKRRAGLRLPHGGGRRGPPVPLLPGRGGGGHAGPPPQRPGPGAYPRPAPLPV